MSLVDTSWLENNIDKVKIIDCSWHMPQTQRNGFEEYTEEHIPNAIFFDLDKNSKLDTDLPHMLTNYKRWEEIVSKMGIANDDEIVKYCARLIMEGNVVGWYQGKMEWGPRGLGNRSIPADPRQKEMKDILN